MSHTPGPWGWQKMGDWCLVGTHGMRPIVLSVRTHGPIRERGFTSLVSGLLGPFDPGHPDAKLIAAAPALADVLEEAFREAEDIATATGIVPKADFEWRERARAALRAAGRLVEDALKAPADSMSVHDPSTDDRIE